MTDLAFPPAPTLDDHGLIGDRELVCVQTIDIGRLRSAPVPITPGTFIAVSGRGPKGDSNGSGKTTFLAAVALLHGEVGWHLASGAPRRRASSSMAPRPGWTSSATLAPTTDTSLACSAAANATTRSACGCA